MKIKNSIGFSIKIITVYSVLIGCAESSIVGEDFIEEENFTITEIDTISFTLSTVKFDSLVTSSSGRLLLASHQTETGNVISTAYFNIGYGSSLPAVDEKWEYDSIVLVCPMDGYLNHLPEAGAHYTLLVNQLEEQLTYNETGGLYNISERSGLAPGSLIGQKRVFVDEDRVRSFEIRLSDQLGEDLFDKLLAGDEIFEQESEFQEYIKGFRLSLAEDSSAAIGFSADSIRLELHVTNQGETTPASHIIEFNIGLSPYYSKIETENVPPPLNSLESIYDEIGSSETENTAYLQGGSGFAVKVDLSQVRNLLLTDQDFILAKAELKLSWLPTSSEIVPETFLANYVDEELTDLIGVTFESTLIHDDVYNRDNYYTLDITSITDALLTPLVNQEYYLLIRLQDFNTSTTSVLLGDQRRDSKLIITTISNDR